MRIEATVTMKGIYSYEAATYTGWSTETRYIYNMVAEDGTVYVWKTTSFMGLEVEADEERGHIRKANGKWYNFSRINKNDIITIKATVKGESEYKGQKQTELTRVKVVSRQFAAETYEEMIARKEAEKQARIDAQIASIKGDDFIWRMPYKQYKEHYADCETVEGSFDRKPYRPATIEVIVREGRLKASGVRGEHYSGYKLENADGEMVVYRAVKEENAIRRAEKEFGGSWKCIKVYEYNIGEWC